MSDDPAEPPKSHDDLERLVQLWMKVEDVAMHFNEIILNFRLKALGAVALGAGVVASVLVSKEEVSPRLRLLVLAGAMFFLAVIWVAAWSLDSRYYQRLLRGAVREALRLERASGGLVRLSSEVEAEVKETAWTVKGFRWARRPGRQAFYILPFLALVGSGIAAWALAPAQVGTAPMVVTAQGQPPAMLKPPDVSSASTPGLTGAGSGVDAGASN